MSSLSDHIEAYIKKMLRESETRSIEISRAELAETFACVPSQINYVLSTRFSLERGYLVESRRGGGGYIRVGHVEIEDSFAHTLKLVQNIGEELTERELANLLVLLKDHQILTLKESRLIKGLIQQEVSTVSGGKDVLRASLLRVLLFWVVQEETKGG